MGIFDKFLSAINPYYSPKKEPKKTIFDEINELAKKQESLIKRSMGNTREVAKEFGLDKAATEEFVKEINEQKNFLKQHAGKSYAASDTDDESDPEEEDEEKAEFAENLAKPIFVVRLKRFESPLTPSSILERKDELARYGVSCVLMRDKDEDVEQAHCFFGETVDKLMDKAMDALSLWNEDEDEPIRPVVDILVDAKCYNAKISPEKLSEVAYYIVNEYGEESWDISGKFPFKDSLIRVICEVNGHKNIKDFEAMEKFSGIEEDEEGWVEKMISEHGIRL